MIICFEDMSMSLYPVDGTLTVNSFLTIAQFLWSIYPIANVFVPALAYIPIDYNHPLFSVTISSTVI